MKISYIIFGLFMTLWSVYGFYFDLFVMTNIVNIIIHSILFIVGIVFLIRSKKEVKKDGLHTSE
jgi:hypothetical protein